MKKRRQVRQESSRKLPDMPDMPDMPDIPDMPDMHAQVTKDSKWNYIINMQNGNLHGVCAQLK